LFLASFWTEVLLLLTTFIRKGEVGDWKSHFSASQAQQLTQKFREKTKGTEAANLWSQGILDFRF